ncbi:MAG: hypothetical protein AMXMBFR83_15590 [Phycisphaerae bacterium]
MVFTAQLIVAALAAAPADGPALERIVVCSAERYRVSAYPCVDRLDDGRLICVFSANDRSTGGKMVVAGCFSDDHGKSWSPPRVLIDSKGEHDYDPNVIVFGPRVIVTSTTVPLDHHEFISTSRTVAVRSDDGGRTWSEPYQIPMGYRYTSGKVQKGIVLGDGTALFGFTYEAQLEKIDRLKLEGDMIERSVVLISRDRGLTWRAGGEVADDSLKIPERKAAIRGICEPSIVECSDGSLYMLARTGMEKLYESRSRDGGKSWSPPVPSALTGHNAPASLTRFREDRPGILVVWNNSPKDRWPLCAAASFDDGRTWSPPRTLVDTPERECSYPGCTQAADGALVAVWQQATGKGTREIHAARFKADWLLGRAGADQTPAGDSRKPPAPPK